MYECKRILNRKFILLFLFIILLNMSVFCYKQTADTTIEEIKLSNSYRKYLVSISNENINESNRPDNPKELKIFNKEFRKIKEHIQYVNSYQDNIYSIIDNANQLKEFSIFSDIHSFSYNNALKTVYDFSKLKEIHLCIADDKATEQFLNYTNSLLFALAIMIFCINQIFKERDNGMWQLIYSAKSRCYLPVIRIIFLLIASIVVYASLYFSTFICSEYIYNGWETLQFPIQNIEFFSNYTNNCNQIEYIFIVFLYNTLILAVCSMVIYTLLAAFRKKTYSVLILAGFTGIEYVLYKLIPSQSGFRFLKYVNLIRLFNINEVFAKYSNYGYGKWIFSEWIIIAAILIIVYVVCSVLSVIEVARKHPFNKNNKTHSFIVKAGEFYQHILEKETIYLQEIHKMFITCRGGIVVIILIIVSFYYTSASKIVYSDTAKERDIFYLEYGGKDYSEITQRIKQVKEKCDMAYVKLQEAVKEYENSNLSLEDMVSYTNTYNSYKQELAELAEYIQKQEYLDYIQEKYGISGYMMSDRGYEELFGKYSYLREFILFLSLIISMNIIIIENQRKEYTTKMYQLIYSLKNGRGWIEWHRVVSELIVVTSLFVMVYAIDMIMLCTYYGLPYLEAPAVSLTFMEHLSSDITIKSYMFLGVFIRFFVLITVYILTKLILKKWIYRHMI